MSSIKDIDSDLKRIVDECNGNKDLTQQRFNEYFRNIRTHLDGDWKNISWQYYLKYSDR